MLIDWNSEKIGKEMSSFKHIYILLLLLYLFLSLYLTSFSKT